MEVDRETIDIEIRLIEQDMVELKQQIANFARTMRDSIEDAAEQLSAATQGLQDSAKIAKYLRVSARQVQDIPEPIEYKPIIATEIKTVENTYWAQSRPH